MVETDPNNLFTLFTRRRTAYDTFIGAPSQTGLSLPTHSAIPVVPMAQVASCIDGPLAHAGPGPDHSNACRYSGCAGESSLVFLA